MALTASFVALAVLFGFVFGSVATYPDEDAYITYAYSKNLAAGNGPTYNGLKVEGYTNLLTMLVVAGVSKVTGLQAAAAGFLLSALFWLLTLMFAFVILQKAFEPRLGTAHSCVLAVTIVSIGLLFNPFVTYWGLSGMESSLFSLALTSAVYFVDEARPVLALTTLSLLPVIRYDGLPILIVALLFMVAFTPGVSIRRAAVAFVPWAAAMLFRIVYYGAAFPHTAYIKYFLRNPADRIHEGLCYTWNSLWGSKILFLFAGVLLLAAMRRAQWRRTSLLLLGLAVAGYCQTVCIGGDVAWKPFGRFTHWQLVAATLSFFLLLRAEWWLWTWVATAALGVSVLFVQPNEVPITGMFCGTASIGSRWDPNYIVSKCFLEDSLSDRWSRTRELVQRGFDEDALVAGGKLLRQIARDGDTLVTSCAGRAAYHSGLPTLDITSLASREIWDQLPLETKIDRVNRSTFVLVHSNDRQFGSFMARTHLEPVAMVSSEKHWGVSWLVFIYASRKVDLPPQIGTKDLYLPVFPTFGERSIPVYADFKLTAEKSAALQKSWRTFIGAP